jgi:CheY-like chemotaxis protein/signal transduction histidine kinase
MQGIEIMSDALKEYESHLSSDSIHSTFYQSFVKTIKVNMKNIQNTNSFMLMTINRTIDFTKASKGLKLIPKMDTIHLLETLMLPLNCMKNIQDKIKITLIPLSMSIHSYIVTDKQWLQENLLCLLSNAVKYSSGGDITVRVILEGGKQSPKKRAILDRLMSFSPSSKEVDSLTICNSAPGTTEKKESTAESPISGDRRKLNRSVSDKDIPTIVPTMSVLFNQRMLAIASTKGGEGGGGGGPMIGGGGGLLSSPEYLLFEVEDTGIGMTKEIMDSLFSPFKQAQRLAGGTGLGLYSLSKRIEALNGNYGVRQRKDGKQGSLFWFKFPYYPDTNIVENSTLRSSIDKSKKSSYHGKQRRSSDPPPITSMISAFPSGSFTTSYKHHQTFLKIEDIGSDKRRLSCDTRDEQQQEGKDDDTPSILLVEDSSIIAKMTVLMIQKLGYKVCVAENGHIALKMMMLANENRQQVKGVEEEKILEEEETEGETEKTDLERERELEEKEEDDGRDRDKPKQQSPPKKKNNISPLPSISKPQQQRFDLVLMDFQMPVMDGLEATRRYREYEKQYNNDHIVEHHLPIIGLSATFDKEIIEEGMTNGLDDYLMKPISKDLLLQKFRKFNL